MTGSQGKAYSIYNNVKSRVLNQALKELKEKTDIKFEFKEIKTGRKVSSIKFTIHSKNNDNARHEIAATTEIIVNKSKIKEIVATSLNLITKVQTICYKHKITENEASCILSDANNNIGLIKKRYEYLLTQKKVNNVVGYMRSIIITYDKAQQNIKIDKFKNYEQREYDFEKLEKNLLAWNNKN